jgi:hypothetical protein
MKLDSNRYRHPFPGFFGRLLGRAANSKKIAAARHAVLSRLPFLAMESDVTDVVYCTWLVDVKEAQGFVPPGIRLWQRNGRTPFTVLSYQHGHFGPAFAGPLRRLFPSPLQSNWRFYVDNGCTAGAGQKTVFFIKNILNSTAYAFVTRIFSDVLQTHLSSRFIHAGEDGKFRTEITIGAASLPSLQVSGEREDTERLPDSYSPVFGNWENAVDFLVHQDAALAFVERTQSLAISEISLPIQVSEVRALSTVNGHAACSFLESFRDVGEPFCFVVPKVKFGVLSERLL